MSMLAAGRYFDEIWLRAAEDGSLPKLAAEDPRFAAIIGLPDFERFVYVLTVLEGCTDRECAALLRASLTQIEEARLRALQHFWKHD
jgi:DNA-directed RNA polymerase specialized sigma24 family protein